MLKTGIFTWLGYPMDKEDMGKKFLLIKNAGFDSVMIWWGDDDDGVEMKKSFYRPLAEKYDLFIANAHLPFEDTNNLWIDSSVGDNYADFICQQIKECSNFEIPTVVMHLSRGKTPPPFGPVGLERVKRIVDAAEKYNVNLALENLRSVEYLDYIFQNIQSDKMGFCFDSGHNNCFNPERDVLNDYKKHLIALHLDDNMGDADIHMLPFDGTTNWDRIIKTLKEINYKGVLSLEVQQDRHIKYQGLSPEEYLSLAFESATKLQIEIDKS